LSLWDGVTDGSLLDRAQSGDSAAFQNLYERHRESTFRFACLMLGSSDDAEDVTHDCFLSLIRDPGRFDAGKASLRTYLYAAARNLVAKRLRYKGKRSNADGSERGAVASKADPPLLKLLNNELAEKVRGALARLPQSQREAIVLFEYEEQTLAAIAAITGTEIGTVKWRLHQARASLRHNLAAYLNGNERAHREKSKYA
jgi:RNA polymerase sigma-70 factor, ECF subfamily